jgi:predicted nucleic acid-binding protein
VIAVDTSVVVAAFASWHEGHRAALAILGRRPRLPGHAAIESFSVLTRLPSPHRVPPELVTAFLAARFPAPFLTLPAAGQRRLIRETAETKLAGGAIYDALIAATARHAGATLLSRDRRAAAIYARMGANFELVE